MNVLKHSADVVLAANSARKSGLKIGFVPTMGALHNGHLSLIEKAKNECDLVYVSVYVNPLQFNDPNDLLKYPRPLEKDLQLLENAAVDVVFLPEKTDLFPNNYTLPSFELSPLDQIFEGAIRPGHFKGVASVVYRFFELIQPHCAYFGQKDLQQVAVILKLISDFKLPTQLIICPIIREPNGLAQSSRNVRLNKEDFAAAGFLYQTLAQIKESLNAGENLTATLNSGKKLLSDKGMKIDYLDAVQFPSFDSANSLNSNTAIVAAVQFGGIRILDNIFVTSLALTDV